MDVKLQSRKARIDVEPFRTGAIDGVIWRPLRRFDDTRGWLCEVFRRDDIPSEFYPEMGYISQSWAGVSRGPHEHVEQADLFCFLGPGDFKIHLWDNRRHSPTFWRRHVQLVGGSQPMSLIVPPGVVHAYQNVSNVPGIVYNFPNQLYRGTGRKQPVDEIRHEDDANSPFVLE